MKTKTKGKAIAGIAMAAIIAAVILAAVPTASAVSNGTSFNYIGNHTELGTYTPQKVVIGQNLYFNNTETAYNYTSAPSVYRYVAGKLENSYPSTAYMIYSVNWPTSGAYYVSELAMLPSDPSGYYNATLTVEDPNIPLKLKVGTKEVTSLTLGTNLTIDTGGINLFGNDKVDLEIIGPDGKIAEKNSQTFKNITVTALKAFGVVNTTDIETDGWKVGDYTFQIKTKSAYACGLDESSAVKSLTIQKGEIAISAEKTTATELETIKLTVTGVSGDTIWLNATPTSTHVLFQGGVEDTPIGADDLDNFGDTIDADGKRTYAVKFNDTGSYTIKVLVKTGAGIDTSDTVDISVSEKAVTFDVPTTVNIGEKLTIKGTATSGERVTIAVEDTIYNKIERLVIDENGEFSKEIDTLADCGSKFAIPGSVRLKAYIDKTDQTTTSKAVPDTWTDDGSVVVLMSRGGLTAELSATSVAQEDDFTVSGTAKGSKNIDILIVPPKGSGGTIIESGATPLNATTATGIYKGSTSVSETDDTYSKKVTVVSNADTGKYLVIVLSKGSDDVYGKAGYASITAAADAYTLSAKTLEQILIIMEDATYGSAGSDDLYWVGYIKVEAATVTLDPVASVGIGEPLVVSGTTNRKEGFSIVITVKGPVELTPQTVTVENGVFNATFDTADATVGTYTVKADDGDGHTDDATAEILTAVPPTPTPVVEVTATPEVTPTIPVAEATPTPEPTPTPTPTPGFEAVFAIAGLLAVAYLVQRKRRE